MAAPTTPNTFELKSDIKEILKDADLSKITAKKIRVQLEKKYSLSLTDRKQEIDKMVMAALEQPESDLEEETNGEHDSNGKPENSQTHDDNDDDSSDYDAPDDYNPPAKKKKKENDGGDAALAHSLQQQEEEASGSRRTRNAKRPPPVKKPAKPRKEKKEGGGFKRLYELTPALAQVMGEERMARADVVSRMWAIVKERNLQDPKNRQFMICDEELQKVFGRKRLKTFGMMKYLRDHMYQAGDRDILFSS